jgi:ribosomal protein S18 acetylase RimI-like enzyme
MSAMQALDEPAWSALTGPHAALAVRSGRAARYPAEVSPFAAVAALDDDALRALAGIVGAGEFVAIVAPGDASFGSAWQHVQRLQLIQMVCEKPVALPELEPAPLSSADVPDMLALVELTRPGPFGRRTIEMGRYVGFRDGGRLVAMGGERMRPPGHTELSAICASPEVRGRGLAEAVVRALAASIQARGEVPFLHVMVGSPSQAAAVSLYKRVGFEERRRPGLVILRRAS